MANHDEIGVYLYIWRNKSFWKTLKGSFGHASLRLVGPPFRIGNERSVYISWWPKADSGTRVAMGSVVFKRSAHVQNRNYHDDKLSELSGSAREQLRAGSTPRNGQVKENEADSAKDAIWLKKPDAKIPLPTLGAHGISNGLDAMAIYAWWKVFNAAEMGPWDSIRRNCAKIVAAALEAGGATRYVGMPRPALWRPTVVEKWANAFVETCSAKNLRSYDEFCVRNQHVFESKWVQWSQYRRHGVSGCKHLDEVWTIDEWKLNSEGGPLHRRSSRHRKIDALLVKYQGTNLNQRGPHASHYNPIPILQEIQETIHEELMANPIFNREHPAIFILGKQCLNALELWGIKPVETVHYERPSPNLRQREPVFEQEAEYVDGL